jgi:chorismate mutase
MKLPIPSVIANAQRANRAKRASRASSNGAAPAASTAAPSSGPGAPAADEKLVDLTRRRDALNARVAELQWDLGGLVYEMAVRDRIRVDVLVKRAAALQDLDAELSEVERIVRLEQTGTVGSCSACGAPHSSGAVYCWQCGRTLLEQVPSEAIGS